jgi:hypothetical protein
MCNDGILCYCGLVLLLTEHVCTGGTGLSLYALAPSTSSLVIADPFFLERLNCACVSRIQPTIAE